MKKSQSFEFDRARSGLGGFTLHGSLPHDYYHLCEAGWKLWPFAHLVTYGVIPVEQRLLWVDCVELIWVTILSTYSNENLKLEIQRVPPHRQPQRTTPDSTRLTQGSCFTFIVLGLYKLYK